MSHCWGQRGLTAAAAAATLRCKIEPNLAQLIEQLLHLFLWHESIEDDIAGRPSVQLKSSREYYLHLESTFNMVEQRTGQSSHFVVVLNAQCNQGEAARGDLLTSQTINEQLLRAGRGTQSTARKR